MLGLFIVYYIKLFADIKMVLNFNNAASTNNEVNSGKNH